MWASLEHFTAAVLQKASCAFVLPTWFEEDNSLAFLEGPSGFQK
jgi:hypothetical protein